MCSSVDFYLTIGTSKGTPEGSCQDAIVKKIEEEAGWYAGFSIFYGFIGFCGMIAAIGIMHVERRPFVPSSFYKHSDWGIKD
jgi:hypothetical protein